MAVDYEQQKVFWEGIRERRDPTHPAVAAFARHKLDILLRVLPDGEARPRTMLEVGAGNGFFSHTFAKSFDLTCVDFSQNMLDLNPMPAERKVQGDAERLPFEDKSFDVVFCGNLLHHLVEPLVAVREMARVARSFVVLVEPNTVNPLMLAFGVLKPAERGTLKFTQRYVRKLGERAGLRPRHVVTQGAVLPNKTPAPLVSALSLLERPSFLGFYHIAVFDVPSLTPPQTASARPTSAPAT